MTQQVCDRCTALGLDCMSEDFVTQYVTIFTQNPAFDNCVTLDDIRNAADPINWVDYTTSESKMQTYCHNHLRYCQWHSDYYSIPTMGHEVQVSDLFIAALRGRVIRGWGIEWILDTYGNNTQHPDSDAICLQCYENGSSCDDCNERYPEGYDFYGINDGERWVCSGCFQHYNHCDEHDLSYNQWSQCQECYEDDRTGHGYIHHYGYKPDPKFTTVPDEQENWTKRKEYDLEAWRRSRKYHVRVDVNSMLVPVNSLAKPVVFLGFELEVEAANGSLSEGARLLGADWSDFLYLKQDGSLSHGMEIVSHPMTLRAHKTLIDWSFLDKLTELGFLSFRTNTCGLHVHVNRAAFDSDTHMYKFGRLFANNPAPMQRLGGRDSSRWGTFSGLGDGIKAGIKNEYGLSRYQAVNFLNSNTLELRFFKGTLRKKRVMCALELTDAAVEYTRQLSTQKIIQVGGITFHGFAKWVVEQPQYENLTYFINTFGLLGLEDSSWSDHETSNEMEV